jgi:3-oxocholest-4-en-26-oate---CoA ligase
MAVEWNFASCWEAIADAQPDRLALVQGERTRTWAEWEDRSARLAAAFKDLGLTADGKVASYLYNSIEYMEGVFATWKCGGAPVNVNYRYLEDELEYLLANSDTEILIFHGALGDRVAAIAQKIPTLKALFQVDDGSPLIEGALRFEEQIEAYEPEPRQETPSGDDLYILYTGGTTGMPKGVMWRNDDLFMSLVPFVVMANGETLPDSPEGFAAIAERIAAAGRTPVHLPASPLMHGTGFMSSLQALTMGGTIVTLESRNFDADELWRAVERNGVTQMAIVGDAFGKPMVKALEQGEADEKPYDLTSLGIVISSGVMWTADVKQGLMSRAGCICLDSLGSSEGVGFAQQVSIPGGEAATTAKFQIGEHAKVLSEDGREIAPGSEEIGLLALGGPIPLGYYKDPEKTAKTFPTFEGRRYSIPGDWARVAADGTIELLGRGSVSINTGGEKVFPEEVEEAVKLHPAVVDAVVVGVPDDRFGEVIAAVVSLDSGQTATSEEIADAVRGHLAGFKRPRHVIVVDKVPRGPNGKADYAWAKQQAKDRVG